MKRALFLALAAGACGVETPAPKPPVASLADAGALHAAPDAARTCVAVVSLAELPSAAPATQCVNATEAPADAPKDAIARELGELAAAPADGFVARRDKLLARGATGRKRLKELSETAPTARARALAAALVTRIEKPAEAKQLDAWAPPKHALMLRNPFPAVKKALEGAYQPYPELAFEALCRARDERDASPPHGSSVSIAGSPLFEIVARGPEGYERLADLAPRFPSAFGALVRVDAKRGSCAALHWLDGKLPEAGDERGLGVLGALDSDDPLALHLLRQALRAGPPEQRAVAADALARRKDPTAVPDLLVSLADKGRAGPARAALVAILGDAEAERKLSALASDCRAEHRLGAAIALRWSASELAVERLAELAGDLDPKVRVQALDSLAWLAVTAHGAKRPFGDTVVRAVIAATGDADATVRAPALNALWRLVVEKQRPLDDAMRSAWARALSDPDARAKSMALVELDDFFPDDWRLLLVVLGDLGRVPDEWPHGQALAEARQKLGQPARERVVDLARGAVPEVRAILEAWLAKK